MTSTAHGRLGLTNGGLEPSSSFVGRLLTLLALAIFGATGCKQLYLPRFDPTGQSVFLPCPNTTELSITPKAAFQQPTPPPACQDGGSNSGICNMFSEKLAHVHKKLTKKPGSCGEMQVTPMLVVAPVGGEVVLLAGICGSDGYLVKRQPIEWMLSPDSVGTFIEVGDDAKSKLISSLRQDPKVEKLDVDFARGRTSNRETLITRGSPQKTDDIQLQEGQTWLSISSPSEGLSRITVLAPESEIWDQRRQTATIYWVDAQWEFPQPQVRRSGEGAELLTRVTMAENLKPATGWTVLYEIVDPSVAVFAPPADPNSRDVLISGNVARVRVDESGQARISVTAPPGVRGTTAVLVSVIRPAQPNDRLPELLLGQGQTVVTFSSAGLELRSIGPQLGSVGEQLTYSAIVGNPGDLDAENVQVIATIPAGMRLISTSLQPTRQTQNQLAWDQGILAARSQLEFRIILESQQVGDYSVMFSAGGEPRLQAESSVATRIVQPSVDARFQPANGIAEVEVGNTIDYIVEVTNTGRQTLTDVKLKIESDPNLTEFEQGHNLVEQEIPMLQPGQSVKNTIRFKVQREGQLAATLKVVAGGTILAERPATVVGIAARPKQPGIAISIDYPQTVAVGQRANATITLKNTGETTLTGLRVVISSDVALQATRFDSSNVPFIREEVKSTKHVWTPQNMLRGTVGETITQLFVEYEPQSPAEQAVILVEASCNENVTSRSQAVTRITGGNIGGGVMPPAQPGSGGGGAPQTRTGELKISLNDLKDPTVVGEVFRYALNVTNNQNMGDNNITIQLKIPQGLELVGVSKLTGERVNFVRSSSGDAYELQPIVQFLPPGQPLDYIIEAKGLVPSNVTFSAAVRSDAQPTWKLDSESTTILPAGR